MVLASHGKKVWGKNSNIAPTKCQKRNFHHLQGGVWWSLSTWVHFDSLIPTFGPAVFRQGFDCIYSALADTVEIHVYLQCILERPKNKHGVITLEITYKK